MKKLLFVVLGLTILTFVIALHNQLKTTSDLPDNLSIIEENTDGIRYIGVKELSTNAVLVPADEYSSVQKDENLIQCQKANQIIVYLRDGSALGNFERFNHWTTEADYYLGVKYDWHCFYFPKEKTNVWTKHVFYGNYHLLMEVNQVYQIRDFYGSLLGELPINSQVIQEKESSKNKEFFFMTEENNQKVIYDMYGKKQRELTNNQWQKMRNNLTESDNKQNSTILILQGTNILD